jgi:hypothetical protein
MDDNIVRLIMLREIIFDIRQPLHIKIDALSSMAELLRDGRIKPKYETKMSGALALIRFLTREVNDLMDREAEEVIAARGRVIELGNMTSEN